MHQSLLKISLLMLIMSLVGCGRPNPANIVLRKEIQDLNDNIQTLQRMHLADQAKIAAFEKDRGTVPTLPETQLAKLFTVHAIELLQLTGGSDPDPSRPGDEGIRVYAMPTDDVGDPIKAAGSFKVELFDLNKSSDNLLGTWEFSAEQIRSLWYGKLFQYRYVLPCPWQTVPSHADLTVKVSFSDGLTGRIFIAQKPIKVTLPPTSETTRAK